ncbi:uncharacterized protein LOC126787593 [Argentina anserina]|uniref:uncharacterized protein LOC126787593 n=1 Tax=Argentina anserina TaxID=57926 RepID=UPI0021764EA6|nr:uncharacterized protein LOC126787593 [Potentilla anserina]
MAALKRNSDDVGWEYGEMVDPLVDKDKVRCKLCGKLFSGGVYRIKRHVSGIRGVVKPCPNSSEEQQHKCRNALTHAHAKKNLERKRSSKTKKNGKEERKSARYCALWHAECERNFLLEEENKGLVEEKKNLEKVVSKLQTQLLEKEGKSEEGKDVEGEKKDGEAVDGEVDGSEEQVRT